MHPTENSIYRKGYDAFYIALHFTIVQFKSLEKRLRHDRLYLRIDHDFRLTSRFAILELLGRSVFLDFTKTIKDCWPNKGRRRQRASDQPALVQRVQQPRGSRPEADLLRCGIGKGSLLTFLRAPCVAIGCSGLACR
ncbi:hypothetical protein BN77_p10041 [Rhizobium mesoamericanum STM3625]|uniref:Uncharacterized protein n=1 Tax=Rhizobium mesoamericanum STM3625 TaxID=1211777 RepID=K0Q209_9HYPH|nr:hypothetical protein BN77_p10041 [Rhizobium mesoamericanum STM3625]